MKHNIENINTQHINANMHNDIIPAATNKPAEDKQIMWGFRI
jgi:hypothetical protein